MRVVVQERAGNALKHLAKVEPLKHQAAEEIIASPAALPNLANVIETELATRSSMKRARGLERSASMMGRQGVIVTQGANNIKMPSGWRTKRMRCGNIV